VVVIISNFSSWLSNADFFNPIVIQLIITFLSWKNQKSDDPASAREIIKESHLERKGKT
jgi:hypothetical protein